MNESSSSGNDIVKLEIPEDFSESEEIEEIEFDESYSEPSTTSLSGQDVITTNQIATFDSSKPDSKKTAGWLTTNHITGEKSRVLLIPILYKKRYAKIFDEKGKGCKVKCSNELGFGCFDVGINVDNNFKTCHQHLRSFLGFPKFSPTHWIDAFDINVSPRKDTRVKQKEK